jgi:hypothetical protein
MSVAGAAGAPRSALARGSPPSPRPAAAAPTRPAPRAPINTTAGPVDRRGALLECARHTHTVGHLSLQARRIVYVFGPRRGSPSPADAPSSARAAMGTHAGARKGRALAPHLFLDHAPPMPKRARHARPPRHASGAARSAVLCRAGGACDPTQARPRERRVAPAPLATLARPRTPPAPPALRRPRNHLRPRRGARAPAARAPACKQHHTFSYVSALAPQAAAPRPPIPPPPHTHSTPGPPPRGSRAPPSSRHTTAPAHHPLALELASAGPSARSMPARAAAAPRAPPRPRQPGRGRARRAAAGAARARPMAAAEF